MKIYTTFFIFKNKNNNTLYKKLKNSKTQIMIKYTPQFNKKYTPIFKLFITKILINYIKIRKI